jgi:hypothetical protein
MFGTEVYVYRMALTAALALSLSSCAGARSGKVILTEDGKERYVQLREGRAGYVLSTIGRVENRPDLKNLREVHGDLNFVCTEMQGVDNPRILIESKNKAHYQVVYKWGDRDALKVIAKPLGLLVTQEEREIQALTVRASPGGHRLKPAAKDKRVKVKDVCCDVEGRWPLDGVTADELARFLETRYRHPVVNLTGVEGAWCILLSAEAGNRWPSADEKAQLDDLGLELRWEQVKVVVTVVKDRPKEEGK